MQWEEAVSFDDIVEVPYVMNNLIGLPKITIDGKVVESTAKGIQRIILQKMGQEFSEIGVLNYMPDSQFKGDIKKMTAKNISNNKFSGFLTFQSNFSDIFIQKSLGGVLKAHFRGVYKNESKLESRNYDVCTTYQQCTDWYQSVNGGPYVYINTTCRTYDVCETIITNDNGSSPPGTPVGGTGTGTNSNTLTDVSSNGSGDPILWGHLCPKQFSVASKIGNAFYINLQDIKMGYLAFPWNYIELNFSSLCIQTPSFKGINLFSEVLSSAFDAARVRVFRDIESHLISYSTDAQVAFKKYYKQEIVSGLGVTSSSVTVSSQSCSGSVSITPSWSWTSSFCPN